MSLKVVHQYQFMKESAPWPNIEPNVEPQLAFFCAQQDIELTDEDICNAQQHDSFAQDTVCTET